MLGACKAEFGHAETVAGAFGLARTIEHLKVMAVTEILHLRQLNTYVQDTIERAQDLGDQATIGCGPMHCGFAAYRMKFEMRVHTGSRLWPPRQRAPRTRPATDKIVIGTSAFAFQGTNAHVLLSNENAGIEKDAPLMLKHYMRRQRLWFTPRHHALLANASFERGSQELRMDAILPAPTSWWILDHVVSTLPKHQTLLCWQRPSPTNLTHTALRSAGQGQSFGACCGDAGARTGCREHAANCCRRRVHNSGSHSVTNRGGSAARAVYAVQRLMWLWGNFD